MPHMYEAAKKEVLLALYQHTVLTAGQLEVLLHYRKSSIYGMMVELKRQGLVRRVPLTFLRNHRVGYALLPDGAKVAAVLSGEEQHFRQKSWQDPPVQLEHEYGANEFFISLIRHSLSREQEGMAEWLSARDAAERYAHFKSSGAKYYPLRPDGCGLYVRPQGRLVFHLEYDTGSENLSRLQDKLLNYARVLAGIWERVESVHVLVLTKIPGRTRHILEDVWDPLLHGVLFGQRVPKVWAISEPDWIAHGPLQALWLGAGGKRQTLWEMDLLSPVSHALPLLGKQQRERSPAEKWKKKR